VSDVAGAEKNRGGKGLPHAPQVVRTLGHKKGQWETLPSSVRRGQKQILPCWVKVAIIPGGILLHHGTGRRMHGHVINPALAHHPHLAPIVQTLQILCTRSHASPFPRS
jgi:hypothetical protein